MGQPVLGEHFQGPQQVVAPHRMVGATRSGLVGGVGHVTVVPSYLVVSMLSADGTRISGRSSIALFSEREIRQARSAFSNSRSARSWFPAAEISSTGRTMIVANRYPPCSFSRIASTSTCNARNSNLENSAMALKVVT